MPGPDEKRGEEATAPVPEKPAGELSEDDLKKVSGGAYEDYLKLRRPSQTGVNEFSPGDGPKPPTGLNTHLG